MADHERPCLWKDLGMSQLNGQILMGSILLDVNRWGNPKKPTYRVSQWVDRFLKAGFDGLELWEYHATLCSDEERRVLIASDFLATIYNTYCDFDDASALARQQVAKMIDAFGSVGVKFNVGKEASERDIYLKNLRIWREMVPASCTLMCECHPGTIVEEPEAARKFFDDLDVDGWEVMVHCFLSDMGLLKRWFDQFGPKVTHAHVQLRDENRDVQLLKDHPVRVKEALNVMYNAGFSGSFTIEFAKGTRKSGENIDDLWSAAVEDLALLRAQLP